MPRATMDDAMLNLALPTAETQSPKLSLEGSRLSAYRLGLSKSSSATSLDWWANCILTFHMRSAVVILEDWPESRPDRRHVKPVSSCCCPG